MVAESGRRGPGRPPAASRKDVERVALALMLRDGYEAVSVDAIATAAGIGRTTFFRYFGSKPGVVWAPFDDTITWLHEALNKEPAGGDVLDDVRTAILASTRSALDSSDVWLERFQLLDSHPSLRGETYEHWERWKQAIVLRIAQHERISPHGAVPMAIAGACQGVFLAELRDQRNRDERREGMLGRLDANLQRVCRSLRPLLEPDGF